MEMLITWAGQVVLIISALLAITNIRKNFLTKKEHLHEKEHWELERRILLLEEKHNIVYKEIEEMPE